jgi:transcriptional regulator with XRE-family HTH domain
VTQFRHQLADLIDTYLDGNQSALGRRTGHSHTTISRYLNGSRQPTREAVELLADGLGVTQDEYDELMLSCGFIPDHWREEVSHYMRLPGKVRRVVMTMAQEGNMVA